MGPISVDRLISISSEEQTNKAENILNASDPHQTWRCKAGEKHATVILQFLKPSIISTIDIGNDNSAFVEIFVGKSTSDEFKVLLVTSSLMTLHECKNGLNVNKVRFFDTDQLSSACKESWDRVKIVCTQPYIKQAKFGLSFITFHSNDEPKKEAIQLQSSSIQLGMFKLKNDDDPDDFLLAGKLFAKRHENREIVKMPESPVNRLLALHKKNLETAKQNKKDTKTDIIQSPKINQKATKSPKVSTETRNMNNNVKNDSSVIPSIENTVTKSKESITSSKNLDPSNKKIKLLKNPLPVTKPFSELLSNVIFSMSGYENPYRSHLRSKALEMGAIYKKNCDQSCTHLVCAFINTPKFQEAKKQGVYRIVKCDWIEKCYSNRCRYPWRRFALDKLEQNKPESDDEIYELIGTVTDDIDNEWNPISTNTSPVPSTSQIPISTTQNNIYDADTDIDSDSDVLSSDILADESDAPLPLIENVFRDCSFYLSSSLKPLVKRECYRYIIALDGKLSTKDKCNYIVTIDEINSKFKKTVTPQWIWDCYDAGKII